MLFNVLCFVLLFMFFFLLSKVSVYSLANVLVFVSWLFVHYKVTIILHFLFLLLFSQFSWVLIKFIRSFWGYNCFLNYRLLVLVVCSYVPVSVLNIVNNNFSILFTIKGVNFHENLLPKTHVILCLTQKINTIKTLISF